MRRQLGVHSTLGSIQLVKLKSLGTKLETFNLNFKDMLFKIHCQISL